MDIRDWVNKPIIRNDKVGNLMNKMTDEEILVYEKHITKLVDESGVKKVFPDYNAAHIAKMIDCDVLHDMFVAGGLK